MRERERESRAEVAGDREKVNVVMRFSFLAELRSGL
jgi:hypothetical protein